MQIVKTKSNIPYCFNILLEIFCAGRAKQMGSRSTSIRMQSLLYCQTRAQYLIESAAYQYCTTDWSVYETTGSNTRFSSWRSIRSNTKIVS